MAGSVILMRTCKCVCVRETYSHCTNPMKGEHIWWWIVLTVDSCATQMRLFVYVLKSILLQHFGNDTKHFSWRSMKTEVHLKFMKLLFVFYVAETVTMLTISLSLVCLFVTWHGGILHNLMICFMSITNFTNVSSFKLTTLYT